MQSRETPSPSLYFEILFLGKPIICMYQIPSGTSQCSFRDFNARVSDELNLPVQKLTALFIAKVLKKIIVPYNTEEVTLDGELTYYRV